MDNMRNIDDTNNVCKNIFYYNIILSILASFFGFNFVYNIGIVNLHYLIYNSTIRNAKF